MEIVNKEFFSKEVQEILEISVDSIAANPDVLDAISINTYFYDSNNEYQQIGKNYLDVNYGALGKSFRYSAASGSYDINDIYGDTGWYDPSLTSIVNITPFGDVTEDSYFNLPTDIGMARNPAIMELKRFSSTAATSADFRHIEYYDLNRFGGYMYGGKYRDIGTFNPTSITGDDIALSAIPSDIQDSYSGFPTGQTTFDIVTNFNRVMRSNTIGKPYGYKENFLDTNWVLRLGTPLYSPNITVFNLNGILINSNFTNLDLEKDILIKPIWSSTGSLGPYSNLTGSNSGYNSYTELLFNNFENEEVASGFSGYNYWDVQISPQIIKTNANSGLKYCNLYSKNHWTGFNLTGPTPHIQSLYPTNAGLIYENGIIILTTPMPLFTEAATYDMKILNGFSESGRSNFNHSVTANCELTDDDSDGTYNNISATIGWELTVTFKYNKYYSRISFVIPKERYITSTKQLDGEGNKKTDNVYVSKIGIYNEKNKLIAIGNFSKPLIKNNDSDIKIKFDVEL